MKTFFYSLLAISVFSMFLACGPDTASSTEEEAPTAEDPNNRNSKLSPRFENMIKDLKADPNDHNRNGSFVNLIAQEYLETLFPKKAVEILKTGIIFHDSSNSTESNINLLMDTYKSNPSMQTEYVNFVQSMQIGRPDFPGLDAHIKNLPTGEQAIMDKIEGIRSTLTDKTTGRLNLQKVTDFVNIIELFVMANPNNEQSPTFLKLAAEVVNSVKVYPRAIQFYDWIIAKFPDSNEAPQALFMKGFTLDDGMRKKQAAKPVYEEFLRKYPKNDFADDTKFLLDNITKTDEEIIKQFEEKK